jgi:arylsulfatase A-like enzyme
MEKMLVAKPKNILLITSDQQHASTLGALNPRIKTPALDRLAATGTRSDRAYTPSPVCTPTRASIITGQYPAWHGAWTIGVKLDEDIPTVGDVFSQAGYDTTLVGKAHFQPLASVEGQTSLESQPIMRDLEFWKKFTGPWYGFDHIEVARMHGDESHVGQHYAIWMEEHGLNNWAEFFQPWPPDPTAPKRELVWDLPEEFHYTTWTGERTIANIERTVKEGKPFFIWSSFHDPHPPYLVPEPWASMYDPADMEPGTLDPAEIEHMVRWTRMTQEASPDYAALLESGFENHGFSSHLVDEALLRRQMAIYYGMISFMDDQIGKILDALDAQGIADDTVVVFTSDHGHYLGHHGLTAKGAFHYEDGIRVPFIVRHPGQSNAGTVSAAIQSLVDLPQTFLDICGLPVPGLMQGVSQKDVWIGNRESARSWAICENRHQPSAVHLRTFITDRYKMTVYRGLDEGELYDLQEDPEERSNRWHDPACTDVKLQLYTDWIQAEMEREPTRYARIARA